MEVRRALLVQGNSKLSQAIFHWDLLAGVTCPGKSTLCQEKCYALRSRYLFPQVKERLEWCHQMSRRKDFAKLMIREIRRKGAAFVVRIHCSGDFFDADYAFVTWAREHKHHRSDRSAYVEWVRLTFPETYAKFA